MGREPSCRALGRSRVHRAVAAAKAAGAEVLWIPGDPIFHTRKNMVPDLASHAGLRSIYLPESLCKQVSHRLAGTTRKPTLNSRFS
jgi:hypothetical protein